MNTRLLKSKMVLCDDERFVSAISALLDISRQTASAKLNGESDFNQSEIKLISDRYQLTPDDIQNIFLN